MSETAQERWQPRTLTSVPTSRKSLEEVADSARQTGYAEGFAKGEQEANRQGNQKVQELMAREKILIVIPINYLLKILDLI